MPEARLLGQAVCARSSKASITGFPNEFYEELLAKSRHVLATAPGEKGSLHLSRPFWTDLTQLISQVTLATQKAGWGGTACVVNGAVLDAALFLCLPCPPMHHPICFSARPNKNLRVVLLASDRSSAGGSPLSTENCNTLSPDGKQLGHCLARKVWPRSCRVARWRVGDLDNAAVCHLPT